MGNITAVCEEVNADNNIKLATFRALAAEQLTCDVYLDAAP
jgi:hypothetical protein